VDADLTAYMSMQRIAEAGRAARQYFYLPPASEECTARSD